MNKKKKNKLVIIRQLLNEIESYLISFVTEKKRIIIIMGAVFIFTFIILIGVAIFFIIKNKMLYQDYIYNINTEVKAKLTAPVKIFIPIEREIVVPFKKILKLKVPIKTTLAIPINNTFDLPVKKPMKIKIDTYFPINEKINIDAVLPIDMTANVILFGISKDVRVKGNFPMNVDVPVKHNFHFDDTINLILNDPVSVVVDHVFNIPVDILVDVDMPIDMELKVPLKFELDTEIEIEQELPVLINVEMKFNPLKGFNIKGIKMDQRSRVKD